MKKQVFIFIITLISALNFSSCGINLKGDHLQADGVRKYNNSAASFAPYIQTFENAGRQYLNDPGFSIGDIPINFDTIEEGLVQGKCHQYADGKKEIIIKKEWWDNVGQYYRESLLFHELGHCRLGRAHQDNHHHYNNTDHKLSLMSSYIVGPSDYYTHRNEYLKEIFTHNNQDLILSITNP